MNGVPGGNIHEGLHFSMENGFDLSNDSESRVFWTQVIVFIAMCSLLVFIGMFVYLPILYAIESAKDAIVIKFVELPLLVRKMLFAQASRRVR
ncbi:hypothetical protein EON66_03155, partial [archaeon]